MRSLRLCVKNLKIKSAKSLNPFNQRSEISEQTKNKNYVQSIQKLNIIYLDFIHDKPTHHVANQLRNIMEIRNQIRK